MRFEDSSYLKNTKYTKLEMPFGIYYLFENFFVGELKTGIHLDWKKAETVIKKLVKFYGENAEIGFISNRVNDYSIDPNNWIKLEKNYNLIAASAVVMYTKSTFMNASIEKKFSKKSLKRCMSLKEAFNWMSELKEFNQNSKTFPSSQRSTFSKTSSASSLKAIKPS